MKIEDFQSLHHTIFAASACLDVDVHVVQTGFTLGHGNQRKPCSRHTALGRSSGNRCKMTLNLTSEPKRSLVYTSLSSFHCSETSGLHLSTFREHWHFLQSYA